MEIFPLDIIFASLISHIASDFSNPRAGCKRICSSTISNFNSTNFTVVQMSKKRDSENERKTRLWQTLISKKQAGKKKRRQRKKKPITHAGKPTAGKCCTRVACSESDNPPVSSLCVNLNFYLQHWGKRQLPYRQQQPAAKVGREPQTSRELRVRQPQGQLICSTWAERKWSSGKHSTLSARWREMLQTFIVRVLP